MQTNPLRRLVALGVFSLAAACSGGAGCGTCGQALPAGFPRSKAIENAGSVRLTRPGLDFLADNGPALAGKVLNTPNGNLTFDLPESTLGSTSVPVVGGNLEPTLCFGGPGGNPPRCRADIGLGRAKMRIDSITPNAIRIKADIPLHLSDTPIKAKYSSFLINASPVVHVAYGADGSCANNGEATATEKVLQDVEITIPLVAETTDPRNGYTKLDIEGTTVRLDNLVKDDVQLCGNCGFGSFACNGVLSLIKGTVVTALKNGIQGQVKSSLQSFACTKADPLAKQACPDGSKADTTPAPNTRCVYSTDATKCVPRLLGTDAHIELGKLLASFSPGSQGAIDISLASGGPMVPYPNQPADDVGYIGHTPNGVTLGLLGGALPSPQSSCVPIANLTLPTGIPTPDELMVDQPANWKPTNSPHIGIALAGRYLDYALGSMYNSGLFCLGTSTEQVAQLQSGLVSLIIPSIRNYAFEQKQAPMAIATRPQSPPKIKIGGGTDIKTDPLLTVSLPKFVIDFYVWNYDRYTRILTFQADLTIPMNLQTAKSATNPNGGLVPALGDIAVANPQVTNVDMIYEDPTKLATAISELVGGLASQFLGTGFKPIDLSTLLGGFGLGLEIPDGGIRKLTKNDDDFLGIFATLNNGTAAIGQVDTHVTLNKKVVFADGLALTTATAEKLPELHVHFTSDTFAGTGGAVEYAYAIDNAPKSSWSLEAFRVIKEPSLFLQGKHVLHVSSRLAKQSATEDETPADLPFTIDSLPPEILVERDGQTISVKAFDFVSSQSEIDVRIAKNGAAFGPWTHLMDVAPFDTDETVDLTVEARDAEGNIGQSKEALIRGRVDGSLATAAGGCGCQTPAQKIGGSHALFALSALLVLYVIRRRRNRGGASTPSRSAFSRHTFGHAVAFGSVLTVAATSQGCGCGSDPKTGCGSDCNQACQPALPVGIIGSYTSIGKTKDGTLWVAGFNDAVLSDGDNYLYGDLVVGKYDNTKNQVLWKTVDGLPTRTDGSCPDNDPSGWRKGESDGGDSVGLWTSLGITDDSRPMVAYYDSTNQALKFAAANADGNDWHVHTVLQKAASDYGRYAKLLIVDGKPNVAFLALEPGDKGASRSKVVLARSNVAVPERDSDWTFEDVTVDNAGPCRAGSCGTGEACIKSTGVCTKTQATCTPACTPSQACVNVNTKPTCSAIVGGSPDSYPNGVGDYVSLAKGPQGLGIVAYDRNHGNLLAFQKTGAAWTTTILDGQTGTVKDKNAVDTGDTGIGASLFIDSNNTWHVSYVSGLDESLHYISFTGGKASASEVVDDGIKTDAGPFTDGRHIVGDDSTIHVEGTTITIAYQDATVGVLRVAVGTGAAGARTWKRTVINQDHRFAGYFPQWVPDDTSKLVNFYRETKRDTREMFGGVALVSR